MNLIAIFCLYCFIIEIQLDYFNCATITQVLTISYKIGEYFIFSTLAYLLFYNDTYTKILKIGSITYCTFIISSFFYFDLNVLYSVTAAITAIFLLSYSILIMYDWVSLNPLQPIYERPAFWLVLGFLIYEAGNYFNFILQEIYVHKAINLHSILAFIRNFCFLLTIYFIHHKNKKVFKRLNKIKY